MQFSVPPHAHMALLAIFVTLPTLLLAGTNVWTRIGPDGGDIESLAIDPQNSATLYAGTQRGLFKSTDSGAHWKLVNSTHLAPTAASIDTQDPNTMYAGLRLGKAPNGGPWLFKSTDGGSNWALANSGLEGLEFAGLLTVDPQNRNTIYVAGWAYLNNPCSQNKDCFTHQISKSTDGGTSWSPASTGLPPKDAQIRSLVIDPKDSGTLYAATVAYAAGTATSVIFKSTDGGASWSAVNSGGMLQLLVIDPQDHNTIYAVTTGGLLRSTDAGGTWTQASSNLPGQYVNSLVIDPRNTETIYVDVQTSLSFNNVFKSVDGGKSWAATAFPSGWGASTSMVVLDQQDPGTVYAASNGVFKSTDGGTTWSPSSSGLGGVGVKSFAVDSQNAGTIFAMTLLGLVKTVDGGANWSPLNDGFPKRSSCIGCDSLVIDPRNPRTLYSGVSGNLGQYARSLGQAGKVLRSTDAGANWNVAGDASFVAADNTLPLGDYLWFSGHLAIDPQNSSTLYAFSFWLSSRSPGYTSSIFKSTDSGETWTSLANSQTDAFRVLAFDPRNSSTLYAGMVGGVATSTDGGANWSAASPLPVPPDAQTDYDGWVSVSSVTVDPANSNTVYATGSGGVFKSDDAGATWKTLNSGLSAYRSSNTWEPYGAGSVVIDPRSSTIYVTFGHGVVKSSDGGTSWTPLNAGLPAGYDSGRDQLIIDPANSNMLYLTMDGDGLYTITLVP